MVICRVTTVIILAKKNLIRVIYVWLGDGRHTHLLADLLVNARYNTTPSFTSRFSGLLYIASYMCQSSVSHIRICILDTPSVCGL